MPIGRKGKTILYLHIGSQKTGTTAIQKLLDTNADALKKQKAVYPDFGIRFEGVSRDVNAHWLTASAYNEQTAEKCFEKIHTLADSYRTIILSDEILWNSAAFKESFWENVRAHLREDIELRMLAYVRRQDLYAYSYWAQQVKAQKKYNFDTKTFREYAAGNDFKTLSRHMDYWEYAQAGRKVLGEDHVIFRVFEKGQFTDGNLYSDFLKTVGLSLTEEFKIPGQLSNISLKGNVLAAKRYLNRSAKFSQKGYRLLPYLIKAQKNMEAQGTLRVRNEFTKEERCRLLKNFEESNALAAKNLLNAEDGVLFREAVSEDREPASEYTTEEILDACSQIMLAMMDVSRQQEETEQQLKETQKQLDAIRRSYAYRVGRIILTPARVIKKAVGKQRN